MGAGIVDTTVEEELLLLFLVLSVLLVSVLSVLSVLLLLLLFVWVFSEELFSDLLFLLLVVGLDVCGST